MPGAVLTEADEGLGPAVQLGLPVNADSVGTFRVMVTGQPAALKDGSRAGRFHPAQHHHRRTHRLPLGVHGPGWPPTTTEQERRRDEFHRPVPPIGTSGPGDSVPSSRNPGWRWFPWAIALSLLVVVAVNGGMVWAALRTFPGVAGTDGFDLSNHYNRVLAACGATGGARLDRCRPASAPTPIR